MLAHVAPPTRKVPAVNVRVPAVSKYVLGSNVPAVFVKAATFNALPKITEPPVLLMTRVAVLFTDDNLPVSVCAFVPVKVAVPDVPL